MVEQYESAAFGGSERYTPPKGDDGRVTVTVDDAVCEGDVLGRNGPRVQVRFVNDGSSFVRWFDAANVTDLDLASD
jgi:hypothetical protein